MALLIRHTRPSVLVQLLPPPSRRSVTPGCGARCKLAPFVLLNMFCFYTTRIAYYLTSSAGEAAGGGGSPKPTACDGRHCALWRAVAQLRAGDRGEEIILGEGSQLLPAHLVTTARALGLTLPGSFMSAPPGLVALGGDLTSLSLECGAFESTSDN